MTFSCSAMSANDEPMCLSNSRHFVVDLTRLQGKITIPSTSTDLVSGHQTFITSAPQRELQVSFEDDCCGMCDAIFEEGEDILECLVCTTAVCIDCNFCSACNPLSSQRTADATLFVGGSGVSTASTNSKCNMPAGNHCFVTQSPVFRSAKSHLTKS